MSWTNRVQNDIVAEKFQCGWCESFVASDVGYYDERNRDSKIVICPYCDKPSYINKAYSIKVPGDLPGNSVEFVPEEIKELYTEARLAVSVNAFTASVLSCRKILMHIAVDLGAEENMNFFDYVKFIADQGYVPPGGKGWVDHIRKKGNEANHDIVIMEKHDAEELITFIEMLLKFNYEFPNRIPKPTDT